MTCYIASPRPSPEGEGEAKVPSPVPLGKGRGKALLGKGWGEAPGWGKALQKTGR